MCGKHPTQKQLACSTRIIVASTQKNAWILDPFTGSSTTGIAANLAIENSWYDKEEHF
jgi:site-specific DNA-methyltransferase (adenine-specific)